MCFSEIGIPPKYLKALCKNLIKTKAESIWINNYQLNKFGNEKLKGLLTGKGELFEHFGISMPDINHVKQCIWRIECDQYEEFINKKPRQYIESQPYEYIISTEEKIRFHLECCAKYSDSSQKCALFLHLDELPPMIHAINVEFDVLCTKSPSKYRHLMPSQWLHTQKPHCGTQTFPYKHLAKNESIHWFIGLKVLQCAPIPESHHVNEHGNEYKSDHGDNKSLLSSKQNTVSPVPEHPDQLQIVPALISANHHHALYQSAKSSRKSSVSSGHLQRRRPSIYVSRKNSRKSRVHSRKSRLIDKKSNRSNRSRDRSHKRLQTVHDDYDQLLAEFKSLQHRFDILDATSREAILQKQQKIDDLQDELDQNKAERELRNKLWNESDVEQDYETMVAKIQSLQTQLSEINQENNALRQELMNTQKERAELEMQVNTKSAQNLFDESNLKKMNKQLILKNEHLKEMVSQLQTDMEFMRDNDNSLEPISFANPMSHASSPFTPEANHEINISLGIPRGINTDGKVPSIHSNPRMLDDMSYGNIREALGLEQALSNFKPGGRRNHDLRTVDSEEEDDDDDIKLQLNRGVIQRSEHPTTWEEVLAAMEEKRKKQEFQDSDIDAYSLASNYDNSDANFVEQIETMEEDMRELREMMQRILINTGEENLSRYIGPVQKKVNKIYMMLSKDFVAKEEDEYEDEDEYVDQDQESDGSVCIPKFVDARDSVPVNNGPGSIVSKFFGYLLEH